MGYNEPLSNLTLPLKVSKSEKKSPTMSTDSPETLLTVCSLRLRFSLGLISLQRPERLGNY